MLYNKKQEILNAAEKLFNRFGIKKTAVDEIASTASVAKGTIYNYFGSKEGIIKEILTKKAAQLEESIESSIQNMKDPMGKLKITIMKKLNLVAENPFISDKTIFHEDRNIRDIMDKIDIFARDKINSILDYNLNEKLSQNEKNRIIDTILYAIKGIEETIKNSFENVSMDMIEKDIEFLISIIFSHYSLNYHTTK
jgi:AcrR family transcriptional regulator